MPIAFGYEYRSRRTPATGSAQEISPHSRRLRQKLLSFSPHFRVYSLFSWSGNPLPKRCHTRILLPVFYCNTTMVYKTVPDSREKYCYFHIDSPFICGNIDSAFWSIFRICFPYIFYSKVSFFRLYHIRYNETRTQRERFWIICKKISFSYNFVVLKNSFSWYTILIKISFSCKEGYIMKRKIYDSMQKWKEENGRTALLIDGARRVGKSYIA